MDESDLVSETKDMQTPVERSSTSTQRDPSKIGRYAILGRLGQGGFGMVYLAHDGDLDRPVAIKVPRPERVLQPEDIEAYLIEARILASLDHPHIVPVYDVGRTDDGLFYVVSKFLEGSDLAAKIRQGRTDFRQSAELMATVVEALHYAHTRALVHRDIKPTNILMDASGNPCVADFGLALREEGFGNDDRIAGTPAYMSPEQGRGEGHRVDGRSDIFSSGVVLYELLTGKRPFVAKARDKYQARIELLDLIATKEARPPRQIDDTIPKELERICMKAMSKRASDRYTTAGDMAEDLREFLKTAVGMVSPPPLAVSIAISTGSTHVAAPSPSTLPPTDSDQPRIKVVPKGLRSFDEDDADFFLELLPGPRDRDGLPESLRFWKRKIEQTDPDLTFKVGLIYGPSGCGKSSMIKAGLLPRLAKNIIVVYIEATAGETEARLLRGLRRSWPELPSGRNLVDAIAALRRGRTLRPGQKLLMVIDQFEQWLFARRGGENTELVAALRQCDGEHVQALVMVRDDFWLAASRFMAEMEVDLEPNMNIALVDLFDPRHARKVLVAIGQAYGALGEGTKDLTKEQKLFLDRAISGLVQDGRVISVRLALFAEMLKGKPWVPSTLREVGGTEGVGVTFLEETFASPQAYPKHRLHQKAAQAVLKALLPRSGTDIKGQMRPEDELREVSGYASRPRDFDELIHVLDPELRLITPTDPDGSAGEGPTGKPVGRCYQLTHDYLVHSLRDWLTRKLRETHRGRAELRLAERGAIWEARSENRNLPSALEWANVRLLTRAKDWTESQRRMMKRAGRVHGLRAMGLMVLVALATWAGMEVYGQFRSAGLVDLLRTARTPDVPAIIGQIAGYRRWAEPRLVDMLRETKNSSSAHLHASLALLPWDESQSGFLYDRLIAGEPAELSLLRDSLEPYRYRSQLIPSLWSTLEKAGEVDPSLLASAGALARYNPDGPRWDDLGRKVGRALVNVNPVFLGIWLDVLRPVRAKMTVPLAVVFRDKTRPETEHAIVTSILADYAADDPALMADLLMDADPKASLTLFPVIQRLADETLTVFQDELGKKAAFDWNDRPLDESWTTLGETIVARIEAAGGLVAERFVICQTLSLDEFLACAEALRPSGYRPSRFRPYADGAIIRVAAVWTRDGLAWRPGSGLTARDLRLRDEANRKEKFFPVDVAGYVARIDGNLVPRYAALWAELPGDDPRLYVGATDDELTDVEKALDDAGLIPWTLQALRSPDGRLRYSGVWGRPPSAEMTSLVDRDLYQWDFTEYQALRSDKVLMDVAVGQAGKPQTVSERARAALERAEKALTIKPDALDARVARARARLRLGENDRALDDLDAVLARGKDEPDVLQLRAIARARLGKKELALADLARHEKELAGLSKFCLETVVAAELGEGIDAAIQGLEVALGKEPGDADLRQSAAAALALASKAVGRVDHDKGRRLAARALALLQAAVRDGGVSFGLLDDSLDLDPLRDDPAFARLLSSGHPERRFSGVWSSEARVEAACLVDLDPVEHLRRGRELTAQGYRPVAWSVGRTSPQGPLISASVWHRPLVASETKDRLAERQARAAVALIRLGKDELVWPLLRHSPDPRLRSFIINWLGPLGADLTAVAAELDRFDSSTARRGSRDRSERPADDPPAKAMDAILFHPDTSRRRALILALGTYGAESLSPGVRDPLVRKLLDLYRDDPDSGIHGAAAWSLRQWGLRDKLDALDVALGKLNKEPGLRRWYVNGQGQTFAVIDGPAEFHMGSPANEPGRAGNDYQLRRMTIPRRFAIGTTEVTIPQFKRFLRTDANPRLSLSASERKLSSPDPDGPWIGLDWYTAAHYCNWLSQQEGLPRDQWCYDPSEEGGYDDGMTIPANVLKRTGYRLPTDAEWEYACRSGTTTSRYYGDSTELLRLYARYQANSNDHSWACGGLLPNDLGLFDMLGNEYEWIHDRYGVTRPGRHGIYVDSISNKEFVLEKSTRSLRGSTFFAQVAYVRSANRFWVAPSMHDADNGFRLARTLD